MKKIITSIACCAALAGTLSADFARVEMGVGGWQQEPSGTASYTDGSGAQGKYTSDKKSDTSAYAWLLIKHPIPIVPNLRLEYADIKDSGKSTGDFKDFNIPTGVTAPTTIEMTQFDVIPYYNILDNTFWTTIDLGIDLKVNKTDFTASAVPSSIPGSNFAGYSDSKTVVIPMVYARARVEIPSTDVGLEADVKYITYNGSTVSDIRAKVDYTLGFIPVVQPAIELGYRVQKFDVTSDDKKTKMDMEFKGVYAGVMLRF